MHLIGALASGVNGAESGTASISRRGTSTPATWYSDFEGTSGFTESVSLDGHGGAEVYVNELVDVTVLSSSGSTLRTFTAGVDAPVVEVKSASFTGTNYETAVSAAGEPSTLQSVLDKWKTSSGTTDFNVLVHGAATTLQTFSDILTGRVFNVKDAAYGATGDGNSDDTSAVASAFSAASAAGGGTVFFPPGTYSLASAMPVSTGISIVGSGRNVCVLRSSTSANVLNLAASSEVDIDGVAVERDGNAPSGVLISAAGSSLTLSNCRIGSESAGEGTQVGVDLSSGSAVCSNCSLLLPAESSITSTVSGVRVASGAMAVAVSCEVDSVGSTQGSAVMVGFDGSLGAKISVIGSVGDFSSVTSGGNQYMLRVPNNASEPLGGALVGGAVVGNNGSGSSAPGNSGVVAFGAVLSNGADHGGASISGRPSVVDATDNATINVDMGAYGFVHILRSGSTALTLNDTGGTSAPNGTETVVLISNSSGGTAVTFGTNFEEVSSPTVSAGKSRVFRFVHVGGDWVESGTSANTA